MLEGEASLVGFISFSCAKQVDNPRGNPKGTLFMVFSIHHNVTYLILRRIPSFSNDQQFHS